MTLIIHKHVVVAKFLIFATTRFGVVCEDIGINLALWLLFAEPVRWCTMK
jgi:hypothetical protein